MPTDEKLFAWLDGELDPVEAARVADAVAADPRLNALAARHRALQARLRDAFDPILEAPIPAEIAAEMREPGVIDFGAASARREWAGWRIFPQAALMAATFAIGIVIGTVVPHRSTGPVEALGSQVYAATALDKALDTELASAPTGDIRVGLTYRDHSGTVCRSFTAQSSSGLACRENDRWALRGLLAAPEGQSNAYRMANGTDPALAHLIASSIAGEPFDAAAERAARDNGWR